MKKSFDPYEELGVARDATDDAIKAAARAAHKRTHPDRGGDVDAFGRSRLAEVVLLDPAKRKKFDETGSAEDDRPDNSRGAALQIIEAFMGPIIGAYINSGFAPAQDPRRRDLFEEFRVKANGEIVGLTNQIASMRQTIEFLRDMRSRFEGSDPASPIERSLDRQVGMVEASIVTAERGIEVRKLALGIAEGYSFRFDNPAEPDWAALGVHMTIIR